MSNENKLNDNNLIWIDLEMTGLDPDKDVIIEIATFMTVGSESTGRRPCIRGTSIR